jgi:hypothetical protein
MMVVGILQAHDPEVYSPSSIIGIQSMADYIIIITLLVC